MGNGMKLNIITALFRSGMLSKIKASIPNEPDINWIIVLSDEREILKNECNQLGLKYVSIKEPDNLGTAHIKINEGIKNSEEGFCFFLDDDTTFNKNAYDVFNKYKNDYLYIIGEQKLKDGTVRHSQYPKRCYTDGAQCMVHTNVAKFIELKPLNLDPQADCQFLLDMWAITPPDKIKLINEVISNYNFLR
jgi:hypothetical protein